MPSSCLASTYVGHQKHQSSTESQDLDTGLGCRQGHGDLERWGAAVAMLRGQVPSQVAIHHNQGSWLPVKPAALCSSGKALCISSQGLLTET